VRILVLNCRRPCLCGDFPLTFYETHWEAVVIDSKTASSLQKVGSSCKTSVKRDFSKKEILVGSQPV
jgi:hypothetical protein